MTTLRIDLSDTIGKLKPLHGLNNGPVGYGSLVNVSHYYEELGVPYVRLHDTNWPHPREVDIPQIFPDSEADPDNPESYDFARTDVYIQRIVDTGAQIVYRLGVSIEHTERKYYTAPPADFDRWARICLGIVKHYNYGWANGYRNQVAYWEIWNEADIGDRMWSGSIEQYFELYETTAKMLKAYNPDLMVGGPATTKAEPPHPAADFLAQFLAYCEAHNCPLDFVSWHRYATDPNAVTAHAHDVHRLLKRYGYAEATSHLNEWNYVSFEGLWDAGNEFTRRKAFERQKNEEGASYIAATLTLMQDLPIDIANYYDGQPSALFCGIFDYYGVPQKAYYAFKAFRRLLDYPDRLRVTATPVSGDLRYLAAGNPSTGSVALLVSRFPGEPGEVKIELTGMQDLANLTYDVRLIDKAQDFGIVQSGRLADGETSLTVAMGAYSVALITVH